MARPLRIEYSGAVYHVTSRGNARQAIFRDDRDRQRLLAVLAVEKTRDVKEIPRAQRLVGRPRVER
jgi:putative transposase